MVVKVCTILTTLEAANQIIDGRVYIWHKENSALIETLRGHGRDRDVETDCVTSVSWNPKNAGMFASGGDDHKVRMYVFLSCFCTFAHPS